HGTRLFEKCFHAIESLPLEKSFKWREEANKEKVRETLRNRFPPEALRLNAHDATLSSIFPD
ncbi:MAG: hypothetical protein ACC642_07380, partial [Pseudomonadales bacterium]